MMLQETLLREALSANPMARIQTEAISMVPTPVPTSPERTGFEFVTVDGVRVELPKSVEWSPIINWAGF